jgi:hypothetical protein
MMSESDDGWQEKHRESVAAMPDDVRQAHDHCKRNWQEIMASEAAGCFYCLSIFPPTEVRQWYNEKTFEMGESGSENCTAFCPKCEIDSVIGSKSGFSIDVEFLNRMHSFWF